MVRGNLCSTRHAQTLRVALEATSQDLDAGACLEYPEPDCRVGHGVAVEHCPCAGTDPDPEPGAAFERARADQRLGIRVRDEDARLDRRDRGVLDDRRRAGVEVDGLPDTVVEAAATEIDPAIRSLGPHGVVDPLVELGVLDDGDRAVENRDPAVHPMDARTANLERCRDASGCDGEPGGRRDDAGVNHEASALDRDCSGLERGGIRARWVGLAFSTQQSAEPTGLDLALSKGQPADGHRGVTDGDARGRTDDHGGRRSVTDDHEIAGDHDGFVVRPRSDVDLCSGGRALDCTEDRSEVGRSGWSDDDWAGGERHLVAGPGAPLEATVIRGRDPASCPVRPASSSMS